MIILSKNPTGVAVQLVKWYQCMAVHWQLNYSHHNHIQIFKAVHLDSYLFFDLWSAVLQPPVIQYSTLQYFSTLSLNCHDFLKEHFSCHKMYVLIFSTVILWAIFINKKSRARINQKYPPVFMSKSRFSCQIYAKPEFSWHVRKIFKYQVSWNSVHAYRRTDMTKLTVAFRNLTHLKRSHFLPFLAKHRKCQ